MHVRIALALVALLMVGTGFAPRASRAAYPGANGRIVFVRDNSIVTIAPDGSDPQVLISATWPDYVSDPEWSPGGTMIAFTRRIAGNADIWRMNADGAGLVRLTRHVSLDQDPTWSADGARIAFGSDRTGDEEIHSMRSDGSGGFLRLTTRPGIDREPSWSPDNERIAFVSDPRYHKEIHTMRPDGGDVQRVSTAAAPEEQHRDPAWSPDGTGSRSVASTPTSPTPSSRSSSRPGSSAGSTSRGATTRTRATRRIRHSRHRMPSSMRGAPFLVLDSADLFIRSTAPGAKPTQLTKTEDVSERQPNWQPVPEFPLVDARFSSFALEIAWLYGAGITAGCTRERFCPDDPVSRAQMASFLVRALDLPPSSVDAFTDDEGNTHEADINALAAAGITSGCAVDRYCPKGIVTREAMASFLVRALDLPSSLIDRFTDDEASSHEADINALAAAGITSGCAADRFCPTGPVSRGQMAAFLYRALGRGP